jgi:hypothetical protein
MAVRVVVLAARLTCAHHLVVGACLQHVCHARPHQVAYVLHHQVACSSTTLAKVDVC